MKRDPEEVKKIIYEASKGSPYFLNEQKRDEELSVKVEKLVAKVDALVAAKGGNLRKEEAAADAMIRELEKTRDLSQTVVVVDADAFYGTPSSLYRSGRAEKLIRCEYSLMPRTLSTRTQGNCFCCGWWGSYYCFVRSEKVRLSIGYGRFRGTQVSSKPVIPPA